MTYRNFSKASRLLAHQMELVGHQKNIAPQHLPIELIMLADGQRIRPSVERKVDRNRQSDIKVGLARIIGNNLPPRTSGNQSVEQLIFQLRHEVLIDGFSRHWILNRLVDESKTQLIRSILDAHGERWTEIPFNRDEFDSIAKASQHPKSLYGQEPSEELLFHKFGPQIAYLMNVNGARNCALELKHEGFTHIAPFDGGTFLTHRALESVRCGLRRDGDQTLVLPMARLRTWEEAQHLQNDYETGIERFVEEPQLIFPSNFADRFDERYVYGSRSKIEMLWRLGIPGPWDNYQQQPWEPKLVTQRDQNRNSRYTVHGWVYRLPTNTVSDTNLFSRAQMRYWSIVHLISRVHPGDH